MSYAQPAQGDKLDLKNHGAEYLGKLFLIFPSRIMTNVETSQGTKDRVVVADVAIIDLLDPLTGQPTLFREAWLFGTVLVNQTANEVPNGKVLGRLSQGANTKGNPPWMLSDYSDADRQTAEQYEAAFPRNAPAQPSGPVAATPPPTPDPWPLPAAAAPAPAWAPPAPAAPAAAPVGPPLDPNLKAFLEARGINTVGMGDATARQIAASFPAA